MAFPEQVSHGWMYGKRFRLLTDHPDATRWTGKHSFAGPIMEPHPYRVGQIVKCVMVSRFGDCGVTDNLDAEHGYDLRVLPEQLALVDDAPAPAERSEDAAS